MKSHLADQPLCHATTWPVNAKSGILGVPGRLGKSPCYGSRLPAVTVPAETFPLGLPFLAALSSET